MTLCDDVCRDILAWTACSATRLQLVASQIGSSCYWPDDRYTIARTLVKSRQPAISPLLNAGTQCIPFGG